MITERRINTHRLTTNKNNMNFSSSALIILLAASSYSVGAETFSLRGLAAAPASLMGDNTPMARKGDVVQVRAEARTEEMEVEARTSKRSETYESGTSGPLDIPMPKVP